MKCGRTEGSEHPYSKTENKSGIRNTMVMPAGLGMRIPDVGSPAALGVHTQLCSTCRDTHSMRTLCTVCQTLSKTCRCWLTSSS